MFSKKVNYLIGSIFLIKILLGLWVPVFSDEAYYWIWSKHLQLSYFDHPAMVAWLIHLNSYFFSTDSNLTIRFSFILLSTLTLIIWLKIFSDKKVAENQNLIFLLLLCLNPMLGVGSILATPDVPLVFFWSLSYLFFIRVISSKPIQNYIWLGICLGLGFCSKYHVVLFVLSGLIALLVNQNYKKIRIQGVLLTVFFGFIATLPVIAWNYQNNWASFLFQLKHGFGRPTYKMEWTWGYLVGQFLLISPMIFISLCKKPFATLDKIFSISQLIFFLTSSFKAVVEANWPIAAHNHAIKNYVETDPTKKSLFITFGYWGLVYFLIALVLLIPSQREKIFLGQKNSYSLEALSKDLKSYSPLYGPTYQVSSLLSWNLQRDVPKLKGLSRYDFFDSLPRSIPHEKEFYVLRDKGSGWPDIGFNFAVEEIKRYENLDLILFRVLRSN